MLKKIFYLNYLNVILSVCCFFVGLHTQIYLPIFISTLAIFTSAFIGFFVEKLIQKEGLIEMLRVKFYIFLPKCLHANYDTGNPFEWKIELAKMFDDEEKELLKDLFQAYDIPTQK